jgi:hypothetical protein
MDTVSLVIGLSVLLQVTAAIMALRLIPLSGRASAWLLFSLVFLLMSVRRTISLLYEAGFIDDPQRLHALTEPLALVISVLLVVAVHLTRGIFADLAKSRAQTEQQLDELRRFQKSVVTRELRLKELEEENASLKNRLRTLQGPAV